MKKENKRVDIITIAVLLILLLAVVVGSAFADKDRESDDADTAASVQTVLSKKLGIKDFAGKRIGIQTGTVFDTIVWGAIPDAQVSYFNSYTDLELALTTGKIDAFAADEPIVRYMMAADDRLTYLDEYMDDYEFGFCFQKTPYGESLCEEFSDFIKERKNDGTLKKMEDLWFGSDESAKVIPPFSSLSGEKGTLTLATEAANAPFVYMSEGSVVGYEVDIAYNFCKERGYALDIQDMNFDAILPSVVSGRASFGAATMTISEERKESVSFSEPHYSGGTVLAVRAADKNAAEKKSKTFADYNGKNIGIQTGTTFDEKVREYVGENVNFRYYNSYTDLLLALMDRKIDAFTGDEPVIREMMATEPRLSYLPGYMEPFEFAYIFKKDSDGKDLCDEISAYIREIKENGTYDEIMDIWLGADESLKVVPYKELTSSKGTIHLATESQYAPCVYIKDGEIVGYEIDLLYRFCKAKGYALEITDMNFDVITASVSSGKFDIGCSGMSVSEEKKDVVYFSEPTYSGGVVLAVRAEDTDISTTSKTMADGVIDGDWREYNTPDKKLGIITGSSYENATLNYFPESEYLYFSGFADMNMALLTGTIDACVSDEPTAMENHRNNPDFSYFDEYIQKETYHFMLPKEGEMKERLEPQFNEFFADAKENGMLDELEDIWFGTDESKKVIDRSGLTGENGTIKAVTYSGVPPFAYVADKEVTGYCIDLLTRFCREYGYDYTLDDTEVTSALTGLSTGVYDVVACCMSYTPERAESAAYTDTFYESGTVLLVKTPEEIRADASAEGADEDKTFLQELSESFERNFIRENRYELILQGIYTTLLITIASALAGSLLAFLICLYRRTGSVVANKVCNIYVKVIQGTPVVVLLMILYYVVFAKSGINAVPVAIIGFTVVVSAYVSEIMRSGIESIDNGQREAALALGFTENQSFFGFIFPQAATRFLPVYRGEIISLLKNTSIVGYIAIQDLTKMSDIIRSRTYEAFFPLIATAIIYFILAWVISTLLQRLLESVDPKERKRGVKGVEIHE